MPMPFPVQGSFGGTPSTLTLAHKEMWVTKHHLSMFSCFNIIRLISSLQSLTQLKALNHQVSSKVETKLEIIWFQSILEQGIKNVTPQNVVSLLCTVIIWLHAATYKDFSNHFVGLIIRGGLHFFLYLIEMYRWRSVFPWLRFFWPNSLFALYYLQHHVHIRHRRDYDEQKAVVGISFITRLPTKRETC